MDVNINVSNPSYPLRGGKHPYKTPEEPKFFQPIIFILHVIFYRTKVGSTGDKTLTLQKNELNGHG
jgi:hypothetical protein